MSTATSLQSTDGAGAGDFGGDPFCALFASTASVAKMHVMKRAVFIYIFFLSVVIPQYRE
jgi:hypothetical protein